MRQGRIGLIAAFPAELAPLIRGWRTRPLDFGDRAWLGSIEVKGTGSDRNPPDGEEIEAVAVAAGMGSSSALRACESALLLAGRLDTLISIGFAGAISCGLTLGSAYQVAQVIDGATGQSFATATVPDPPLTLVTIDHVAGPETKARLRDRFHAAMVDMEAATVAKFAREHSMDFNCLKAVTDPMNAVLPDFSRYLDPHGKLRMSRAALAVLASPRSWRDVAKMATNSGRGAAALAAAVEQIATRTRGSEAETHQLRQAP